MVDSFGSALMAALIQDLPDPATQPGDAQHVSLPRAPAANTSNVRSLRRRVSDREAPAPLQAPLHVFLMRMLDEVDYGMVLLNAKGEVWHANHLARAELGRGRVLYVDGSRLCTRISGKQAQLDRAIQCAALGRRSLIDLHETRPDLPCMPDSDSGLDGSALVGTHLAAVPMGHPAETMGAPLPVLVITSRPVVCEELSLLFFAQSYGLTSAERSILVELVEGLEIHEIAEKKCLAVSTVRTHVKQLRIKTRCHSMRELMGKVSTLPPLVSSIKAF